MSHCFDYIQKPEVAGAIKAFSLRIVENLSAQYPEIVPELKVIIQERWSQEKPSFKARAKKFI
jgi:hypothetical protein